MRDLTTGSIPRHLIRLALPMAFGMIFQTMYYLVDLWFVTRLGDAAVAGVSSAGNVQFIVMALTQVLGVGTMPLIANAVGRQDRDDANLVFNQSVVWAFVCAFITLLGGFALAGPYMRAVGADPATQAAGLSYLKWYLPGLGLQFALVSMGSALRGTGIVKPTMLVQIVTVVLNIVLAPVLIAGWGTGRPLGAAGAGLASSIAIGIAVVLMFIYFLRLEHYVGFKRELLTARWDVLARMLRIGVPPGAEFALMFLFTAVIYFVIRDFGAAAQAGYGIGSRVMQSIFLPAMAIAFSAAPLAGQNMGAGQLQRVRDTFRWAAIMGSALMALLTLMCQWRPELFVQGFTDEASVLLVSTDFLRTISWNFVASGLIFTCSGMFQALGNTVPSLISSASRLVTFAAPALMLAQRPGFRLRHVWVLSVVTMTLQAGFTLWLLRGELRRRTTVAAG
ncbi:MATE family efflux transporter [Gemmatimonas phototrophica]|uniref:Multidrug transporter MatE n=1 Tax=Gemmatimonas phototrophica TaxID=1379270 RepID=A0A143BL65_9BACT|nr:MATE family efflux transporter [Gemmatimonas phototrophica]AMW05272.1 multidrug transporter MatE [Gemmatimonas phototrophica]